MIISAKTIRDCSLTVGQFDSELTNLLVTLFHHQNACSQLTRLSNNLKEKFENLLTTKRDDEEIYNDTPLTRIELAIMIHFKRIHLSEPIFDDDQNESKLNLKFSVENELNLAYCFLLAQIDDRLSKEPHIDDLKLLFSIQENVGSLYDIYEKLGENFPNFFALLRQCQYFAKRLRIADKLIQDFQLFIKRYEDFLITFEKCYKPSTDAGNSDAQTDDPNIFPVIKISKFREQNKSISSIPAGQLPKAPVPNLTTQSSIPSSSNIERKSLCVIINIKAFLSPQSVNTTERAGSERDVELIKLVFKNLKFIVLECRYDFTKKNLDEALDHIDNKENFGHFNCLVMFIMSHGLLHSLFTADSHEVIIKDIVRRYADSSPTTIWRGKPRMFFIQACRSLWPAHIQSNNREGITRNDLSPQMLVAYSCSAAEASKRSPTAGSIFIQMLCVTILRSGHIYNIQQILDFTAQLVVKRDEVYSECKKVQVNIQRPEHIEREFDSKFRFVDKCLVDQCRSSIYDQTSVLFIPWDIWNEIRDRMYVKPVCNRK